MGIFDMFSGGGGGNLLSAGSGLLGGVLANRSKDNPAEALSYGFDSGLGFGSSFGNSLSSSQGRTRSGSFVDPTQSPFLAALREMALGQVRPNQTRGRAQRQVDRIMPTLRGHFNTLAGFNPQEQIAAQSGSLKSELGSLFNEQIMPGIQSDAIAAGGFGGGRQGVAEGVATGKIADAFTQGYGDIVQNANAQSLDAASLAGALGEQMFNLGMAPTTAAFGPLAQFADILGGPTVLNQSFGRTCSTSQQTQRSQDFQSKRGAQGNIGANWNHFDDLMGQFPSLANLFGATPWRWPTANGRAISENPRAPRNSVYRRGGSE